MGWCTLTLVKAYKQPMEDYERQRQLSIIYFRGFPRSAALLSASIYTVVTLDPFGAIELAVSVWIVLSIVNFVIRRLFPNFYDLNIWLGCLLIIQPIGTWIIKWPLAAILAVVAVLRGAPTPETFFIMGGLLLADIVISMLVGA